jgi:hypothetical protein
MVGRTLPSCSLTASYRQRSIQIPFQKGLVAKVLREAFLIITPSRQSLCSPRRTLVLETIATMHHRSQPPAKILDLDHETAVASGRRRLKVVHSYMLYDLYGQTAGVDAELLLCCHQTPSPC